MKEFGKNLERIRINERCGYAGYITLVFRYRLSKNGFAVLQSFGGFRETLTNNHEGTGMEINIHESARVFRLKDPCELQNWRCFCFVCGTNLLSP